MCEHWYYSSISIIVTGYYHQLTTPYQNNEEAFPLRCSDVVPVTFVNGVTHLHALKTMEMLHILVGKHKQLRYSL